MLGVGHHIEGERRVGPLVGPARFFRVHTNHLNNPGISLVFVAIAIIPIYIVSVLTIILFIQKNCASD